MVAARCTFMFDEAARDADPTLHLRWVDWVTSLGLDPSDFLPDAGIFVERATNQYELHLSRVRRMADGSPWVDEVLCALVSEPLIIPLGQKRVWPEMREGAVA